MFVFYCILWFGLVTDDPKNSHLREFEGAKERLILCKSDLLDYESLKEAITGCHGVFHTASPVTDDPVSNSSSSFFPFLKFPCPRKLLTYYQKKKKKREEKRKGKKKSGKQRHSLQPDPTIVHIVGNVVVGPIIKIILLVAEIGFFVFVFVFRSLFMFVYVVRIIGKY